MAKLTQFGRMKRRIKRELEAARAERAATMAQMSALLAQGAAYVNTVTQTVITKKILDAWKKEQSGIKLPEERGTRWFDPVMRKLDDIQKYEEAEQFVVGSNSSNGSNDSNDSNPL